MGIKASLVYGGSELWIMDAECNMEYKSNSFVGHDLGTANTFSLSLKTSSCNRVDLVRHANNDFVINNVRS